MDCSSLLLLMLLKLIGILFQEIPASLAQDWSVSYTPSRLCALHHSSVVLPCKYTYPSGQMVTSSAWHYRRSKGTTIERRVAHSLADQSNCSLLLDSVTQDDAGVYQFSFRTGDSTQDLTNEDGVTLEITDLQVDMDPMSDKVLEGDWVMLICGSCIPSLTVLTYTWYKDGRQYKQKHGDYQLELTNIKVEDEGSYQCTISGHEGLLSSAVNFTVNYPPKNIYVSISSSGEIVEGSSVTLTCSSDANPPVKNYDWFKGMTSVGKGKTYNISKISTEHSGVYKCKCSNEVGHQYSIGVTLNVLYPPKDVSVSISSSGEIVEGSSVTLTCSSDANPHVENYTWFKGKTSVGKGKTYNISKISTEHSGEYKCKCSNEVGHQDSIGVTLNVLYPPKNVSVSINSSGEIVEGSSVTLTCSSDANPPVESYNWFKGTTSVGKGKTYNISKISTEHSGEYKCKCSNEAGHQYSIGVTLNVLYPPKDVSVSINSSGEIVEGSSVTLTCSSDSNPPVETYTWFKGKTSVGKGKTYIISKIITEDSGEYTCKCSNEVGHQDSIGVTLNVLYPPKDVSVSISSSGEIVEGSSVTLTCSSDANPPVENYTWFKGTTSVGKGKTYNISKISTEHSGEYKCKCSNEVGHQYSIGVTLNVLYPPKNVSVSISSSGEIVEGSSVTLTCSSDANPPVETYTWYKGKASVGNEKTYIISKISTEHSGEYKCKCSNEVGHQDSIGVTLNVLYPPKKVSVSISTSVEIVEGSSVTLTCSSDANPPVENYTWFKEKESSPVGSGQSYRALQSGQYYCEAQNKHGSERSAAVSVTLNGGSVIVYVAVGVGSFGLAALLSALCWLRSKRQKNQKEEYECQTTGPSAKDDTYVALDLAGRTADDVYHTLAPVPIPAHVHKAPPPAPSVAKRVKFS